MNMKELLSHPQINYRETRYSESHYSLHCKTLTLMCTEPSHRMPWRQITAVLTYLPPRRDQSKKPWLICFYGSRATFCSPENIFHLHSFRKKQEKNHMYFRLFITFNKKLNMNNLNTSLSLQQEQQLSSVFKLIHKNIFLLCCHKQTQNMQSLGYEMAN